MFTRVFVINLDRRRDRWEGLQPSLRHLTVPVERVSAVDGRQLDLAKVPLSLRARISLHQKSSHLDIDSAGAVGASLSHMAVWEKVAAGDAAALVLEDDARFSSDLQGPYWHPLTWLGLQRKPTVRDGVLVPWVAGGARALGAHAYVLTPDAARLLLREALPLDMCVDMYMQAALHAAGWRQGVQLRVSTAWSSPDVEHPSMSDVSSVAVAAVAGVLAVGLALLAWKLRSGLKANG